VVLEPPNDDQPLLVNAKQEKPLTLLVLISISHFLSRFERNNQVMTTTKKFGPLMPQFELPPSYPMVLLYFSLIVTITFTTPK